jgi:hypothetical protein
MKAVTVATMKQLSAAATMIERRANNIRRNWSRLMT